MARRARRQGERLPFLLLVPNLVTILGLCAGLTSIRFTYADRFEIAAGMLIFAAMIDGLDGLLARRLNATSLFGAELDSLSDFVCFGVAPAILMYHFALEDLSGFGWVSVLVFTICCCLRLARFNVMRQEPDPAFVTHFMGVPAPAGALLALLPLHLHLSGVVNVIPAAPLVALWLLGVGVMMISKVRTLSLKSMQVPRDKAIYVMVGMAVVVGLMLTRFWLFLVLASVVYIAITVRAVIKHRKAPVEDSDTQD